jgi:dTDP-4-amino-4,6-dideoxygalactose transaminase
MGAFGCFSFYPTKNLSALGEAGLLTTGDSGLASRARMLRDHGMDARYRHRFVGGNFRMDAMQAAVLRVKAPHLPAWTEARRLNARRYTTLFADAGLLDQVRLPLDPPDRRHVFNQFVIRTGERDALKRHLDERGIGNAIYYPVPLHLQPCFEGLGYRAGDLPESERAAAESLAIPVYPELTAEQQQIVVAGIADFMQERVSCA